MKKSVLLNIIAEWLEEWEMPSLIPRNTSAIDPEEIKHILAIVGPRRSGKTCFMYQLMSSLLQTGRYTKKDILFLDFEDYRLGELKGDTIEDVFTAFQQLAGQPPQFLFFDEIQNLPNCLDSLHDNMP